ncbi:MAG: ComF family protein [Corynebacterium sp.]|nr:ComF family protein [Corynebacterium sp.]
MLREVAELFFPVACAGCGEGGEVLCPKCRQLWRNPPTRITLRVDPGIPVWSLGDYAGYRRKTIVALKEQNMRALGPYIGAVLDATVRYLEQRGELDHPHFIPAPTTRQAARKRGGDVLALVCGYSHRPFTPLLYTAAGVRDSVGLAAVERENRLAGRVVVARTLLANIPDSVVLVDDIATTGATLQAAALALRALKVRVDGAIVLAHA